MEGLAERRLAGETEGPAKRIVDEGEMPLGIAADNDVALVVEEIAITRLALAHLPLQVLQRFETRIETVGKRGETLASALLTPRRKERNGDGARDDERK